MSSVFFDIYNSIDSISNSISKDVLFWAFSTIVQSFVAFVALLGMVTIYRIQMVREDMKIIAEAMRDHLMQYRNVHVSYQNKESGIVTFSSSEVYGYTVKKIIKDIKGLTKTYPKDGVLKRANLELSNLKNDEQKIKRYAILFFSSVVLLLIVSLVLLPMAPILEYTILGLVLLSLIIFWAFASFVLGLNLLIGLI